MTKYIFICLLGLMTTACMASTPNTTPASREKLTAFLADKSQAQVKKILGEPTVNRTEGKNHLWAYQTNECSTLIYFNESGRSQYVDRRGACARTVARR